jgi:hypothetical protein
MIINWMIIIERNRAKQSEETRHGYKRKLVAGIEGAVVNNLK